MKKRHFRIAFRKLTRSKFTTLLNVGGLAIGIAAFVILKFYVSFETSFDKFHEHSDDIYRVESEFRPIESTNDVMATSSFGYGPAMQEEIPEVGEYCRVNLFRDEKDVKYEDRVFREDFVVYADSNFFNFFSFKLLEGSVGEVLSEPNTVVISRSAARKYFNREDPIGKVLLISDQGGTASYAVSGIFEDIPDRSHLHFDFLLSYPYQNNFMNLFWYMHDAYTYIRVASEKDLEIIEEKFIAMSEKYKTRPALKDKTWAISLVSLEEIHMNEKKSGEREAKGSRSSIRFLGIISILILVIAWVNYINIATTKGLERVEDLKIYRIHGAHLKEVLRMILAESILINLVSILFSTGIIAISISLVERFLGAYIFDGFWRTPGLWLLLAVSLAAGVLLTGIIPALLLIRSERKALQGKELITGSDEKLREILLVLQFIIAVVLIVTTLLVRKQNDHLRQTELGVDIDRTLVLKTPPGMPDLNQKLEGMKLELEGLAFVDHVTGSSAVPGDNIFNMLSNYRTSAVIRDNQLYEVLRVDEDYIPAYDLQLSAGRNFSGNMEADNTSLIINENARNLFGFSSAEEALGQEVNLEGIPDDPFTIIGVLKDFHHMSAKQAHTPINLINSNYHVWISKKYYSVKLRTDDMQSAVKQVESIYNKHFKGTSFNFFFLDASYNAQYEEDIRYGRVFMVFSWLGLLIVCLGLVGLTSLILLKRTKEIGIRKVNGASVFDIIRQINTGFIYKLGLALVIAVPLSYFALSNWLESFAERTSLSWYLFIVSGITVLIVTILTVSIQSWRTASRNPVEALRYE